MTKHFKGRGENAKAVVKKRNVFAKKTLNLSELYIVHLECKELHSAKKLSHINHIPRKLKKDRIKNL